MKNISLIFALFSILFTTTIQAWSVDTTQTPDPDELQQFFDDRVPHLLDSLRVPGLAVSIASKDSILFAAGYGYNHWENRQPVEADKTIWRIASISKVVTATAVMQLVEQGVVDLDTDINTYLTELKIPETFDKPITIRQLLTHTPGFDDRYLNKSFRTEEELPPLKEFIRSILPDRIYQPGEIYTYSNIGNALAGLVVEEASGQPFEQYCRNNLFEPLGMDNTSFTLSDKLRDNLYHAHIQEGEGYQIIPFDYLGDYPAGQMLTSAVEFAHFMMAHLNRGIYRDNRILEAETVEAMHSPQFTQHPKLVGSVGFGFHLSRQNGVLLSQHGGGYVGLTTLMTLLPNQEVGIFMAGNSSGNGILYELRNAFLNQFYPEEDESDQEYPLENLPDYNSKVEKFTGFYRGTRYTHQDITKAFLLSGFANDLQIRKNDEGMLLMPDLEGNQRRLIQTEPNLFQSIDDDYHMAFRTNDQGKPEFLFTHGTGALEKIPSFYTISIQQTILLGFQLIFLMIVLGSFVYLILPKKWKRSSESRPFVRKMHLSMNVTATFFILHWVGIFIVLFVLTPFWEVTMTGMAYGMPSLMYAVQLLPFAAILSLAVFLIGSIKSYNKKELGIIKKVLYTLFIPGCLLYIWLLHYWNLLGFRFG